MRIVHRDFPDNHRIVLFGDTHYGARSMNQKVVEAVIRRINSSPSIFGIHMGDAAEAIAIDDKRYHKDEHGGAEPVKQYEDFKSDMRRIKKGLEIIIEGNHDRKLRKYGDFLRDMVCGGAAPLLRSNGLPVTYGTYSSKLHVHTPNGLSYKVFLWHGAGAPPRSNAKDPTQRTANVQAAIIRKLSGQHSDAHVMVQGHYHTLMAFRPPPETVLWDDGEKARVERGNVGPMDLREFQGARYIDPYKRWYGVTGTAKRTRETFLEGEENAYSSWEEAMGFGTADLGWVELVCQDGKLWLEAKFWGE